uniref:Ubiquitin-associated and SH3 domain-containing protein A n=1 Tax=Aotus nancymaae TaxID=37293 RepID=A0A2K5CJW6_AOTNA
MAAGETQLYAKVSNKLKGRSTPLLLEPLLAVGFPVHTSLKALAATGRKTAEEALAWLHGHCNDPSLDDPIPQEYALFLCPTGPLLEKLQEFWRESKRQCSKNRAHEVFPHVTLCDFFTVSQPSVPSMLFIAAAGGIFLYLGFFVNGSPADVIREFAMTFATEASLLAGEHFRVHFWIFSQVSGHGLNLRLKNFTRASFVSHCSLQKCSTHWRRQRASHCCHFPMSIFTLRALFQYQPQNADELMLSPGDYIFVDPTQQDEASEGWVIGISQRTGCRGFLPENYTDRASESDTWVKHRTYTFSLAADLNSRKDGEASSRRSGEFLSQTARSLSGIQALQATVARKSVLVVRHGERVDQIFGKSWLQQCSTPDGKYYRPDLNFPCSLPRRSRGIKDFENDPPLSSCGIFQSRIAGDALLDSGIRISSVFASPALRCVQTAKLILEELKLEKKIKIRVEPGIFEWTKWEAGKTTPTLMSLEELREANFNVDTDYRPVFPLSALMPVESYQEYVDRCTASVLHIVNTRLQDTGVILIVSHGSALDSCTRPLLGLPPRECGDFAQLVRKIPSLGMCFCEENKEEGKWELVNPPVKTLTHGANAAFNWRNWISGN